ncbi:hypothetical protein LY28_00258 [Ruminiclostridium sufflavum DSM 19573]|uniref:Uncharacterized protein n=1 Tax=Ruminiclostridium sufflavum DSM 19573 TaxID=1121337 RepID=A0A318XQK0_9FIRM|nr:hypothetical protein [Ruminiclostridium sufflavum]PYG90375.1 hypothetical protein LY28_00258 [Ruminiclostridium sufflavum DSM 19573]
MINIQKSIVFNYGDSQRVTVYGDFDDLNTWYIVPTPRFAIDKTIGQEMFTLREFVTDTGITGNCNFTVELYVSDEERSVVKQYLGQDIVFGQLNWVNITSFFTYDLKGEKQVANATPAQFAENQATFDIFLPDQEAVNCFKDAFGPGDQGVSPFFMQYEGMALSKLPAVDVTVKYDSVLAFEYEKTVEVDRNIWGKETSRKAAVKEYLKNSDAGNTDIKWNIPNPDEEMKQRVYDWAWITLEGLVNKAVDDAVKLLGEAHADQFSLNQTSSFSRNYKENQVVDFNVSPMGSQFKRFNENEWEKHFSRVDNRSLTINFTIMDDLSQNKIKSVQVNVKYPTLQPEPSHTFTQEDCSNWTLEADGYYEGGIFKASYQYQYIVTFEIETKLTPYTSPWIPSENARVILPAAALGVQSATFRAANVDFDNAVNYVLLDFYYITPGNLPNKSEQIKIIENNKDYKIVSRTGLPSTNPYSYALTYVLKNGRQYEVSPISSNSDTIVISSPFSTNQFNVYVNNNLPEDGGVQIKQVRIRATYDDYENGLTGLNNTWNFKPDLSMEYDEGEPWDLTVVENPNGSVVSLSGKLIYSDGKVKSVNGLKNQTGFIDFSPISEIDTIEVDPSQIQWKEGVEQVRINFYQLKDSPVKAADIHSARADADSRKNLAQLTFRPMHDAEGAITGTVQKQYFDIDKPLDDELVYYYDGTYYHSGDVPDSYIKEAQSSDLGIVLPKDGESEELVIHRLVAGNKK